MVGADACYVVIVVGAKEITGVGILIAENARGHNPVIRAVGLGVNIYWVGHIYLL